MWCELSRSNSFSSSVRECPSAIDSDRRTVIVERLNGSFGFTLQSYGIHYREEAEVEIVTYVDFVDPNGNAHKAGLRSGDVIMSINGQDVERADHAKLVAVIQSCPDRIRMVVVYENCVRKVELHMKYIRLTQVLESKAREYQEVCAREKAFMSRLDKNLGGTGPYYTLHHPSQVALRSRNPTPSATGPGCYTSKSLPRTQSQQTQVLTGSPTASASSIHTTMTNCEGNKRRSYLCIGRPSDCDCCFRPEAYRASASGYQQQQQPVKSQQQRPRSVHLSCYKEPSKADERYLIRPSDRGLSSKAYGGYGFGYEYATVKQPTTNAGVSQQIDHQFYGRYLPPAVTGHKSIEELSLSAQLHNQCRVGHSPHHQQQFQEVSRPPHQPQLVQPQPLDSIVFYTRPPQPSIHPVSKIKSLVSGSLTRHQQPHARPCVYQPTAQGQLTSPGNDDEGGFTEARRFRTLPAAMAKKTADYR